MTINIDAAIPCEVDRKWLHYSNGQSVAESAGEELESLERILHGRLALGTISLHIANQQIRLYVIGGEGFDFDAYNKTFRKLYSESPDLFEENLFTIAARRYITGESAYFISFNCWFDFAHDAFICFTESDQRLIRWHLEAVARRKMMEKLLTG